MKFKVAVSYISGWVETAPNISHPKSQKIPKNTKSNPLHPLLQKKKENDNSNNNNNKNGKT